MSDATENLIAYCRENNRACPRPPSWNALWEMLPERKRAGAGWEPPAPLILAAWHDAPAMLKAARLAEHIEWAASHGALEPIAAYLKGLPESDWFHVRERVCLNVQGHPDTLGVLVGVFPQIGRN